jgi:hypothetical protein
LGVFGAVEKETIAPALGADAAETIKARAQKQALRTVVFAGRAIEPATTGT